MLSCVRYRNRLGAYLDGELNLQECEAVGAHLAKCAVCQKRIEDFRGLQGVLNDTLHVSPVPDGFAARVMSEARRTKRLEAAPAKPFLPRGRHPWRWLAEFPAPMRIAVCGTMLLACIVGLTMGGGLIGVKRGQASGPAGNLYGLEWFESAPPGSIASIYIAMVSQTNEEGNRQ